MAGGRYEAVNGAERRASCCLKFWLAFFVIAALALLGVVIWLVLAGKNGQSPYGYSAASSDGLLAASGHSIPEICTLPAAPGPCRANIQRYFYDSKTGNCMKFIYGGCSGNANSFETLDDCLRTCTTMSVKKPEFCMLEKDPGHCYAALPRYTYDKNLDKCVEFIYGGCGGNRNNFESMKDCEKQCKAPTTISDSNLGNSGDTSVCVLPHETGNCRGYMQRWGFDPSLGKCVQFVYGGCGGNGNNFESLEACEQRCMAYIPMPISFNRLPGMDPVCKLPQDSGPCRGSIRRWAYDDSRGFCVEFTYGGCQGNSNNFETREACEAKCPASSHGGAISSGGISSNPICKLPQDTGPCRTLIPRWTFDSSMGQCVQFTYGGCRGNENNFETKQQCEAACGVGSAESKNMDTSVCHLPRETGSCRGYFQKWGFDPDAGQCVQFVYSGCGGNSNNFEKKEDCEQHCRAAMPMPLGNNDNFNNIASVCKLSKDPGPCRGSLRRWAFDLQQGHCTEFFYGGCQGNENNFESREACEAKCSLSHEPMIQSNSNFAQMASNNNIQKIPVCQMPHERGECMAYIPRWGFDARSEKCVQFIYGGCGGNDNNFETQEDCEKKCKVQSSKPLPGVNGNSIDPVCKLPKEVGPCRGSNRRWTFDFSRGICEEFIYGGCRGNANNFESKEDCEAKCKGDSNSKTEGQIVDSSVCNVPHERGNCRASMQRWGYDPSSGKCVQFIYGGCGGNENNFETEELCQQKCLSSSSVHASASNNGASDPVCRLPQDTGPCRSSIRRWSYDISKGSCVEFVYGGCRGNENNFETREACEAKCGESVKPGESGKSSGQLVDLSICRLPRERGSCLQYSQRWGYDPDTRNCVQFVYGGCGGNKNNFETQEACEQKCLLTSSSNLAANPMPLPPPENGHFDQVCTLPSVVGPCRSSYRRWTYDPSQGGCVEFIYGGCGGNANNFETRDACEAKCGRNGDSGTGPEPKLPIIEGDNDACYMPHERGDCYGYHERWGYEPKTGQCVMFVYGGCGGNSNNFESKDVCELRCIPGAPQTSNRSGSQDSVCVLPKDTGPCRGSLQRWAYDTSANACVEFIYGGCRGNENNFESKEACEARCGSGGRSGSRDEIVDTSICHLAQERGKCQAYIPRWAFDPESGRCVQFIYGGCDGNENNFETKEGCENRCRAAIPSAQSVGEDDALDPICRLPQEVGPCRALIARWAYNASQGRCVEFFYGGCRGNANNFNSEEACENKCGGIPNAPPADRIDALNPICRQPKEVGPCRSMMKRWYFNGASGKCVDFIYGGCQGNANNFETQGECEKICINPQSPPISASEVVSSDTSVCHLPHERGNCVGYMQRWGFSAPSGQCIQFVYGGCGGNANNFGTKAECEQRCIANIPIARPADVSDNLDPVCSLPQEVGPCRAYMKRWYYDMSITECVEFNYGGCRGNANNFETKGACETKCGGNIGAHSVGPQVLESHSSGDTSVCNLPREPGNCFAFMHKWGYDSTNGKCIRFVYGGCGGNENNFETREACEQRCFATSPKVEFSRGESVMNPICRLPQDVGPCRVAQPRWFYDTSSGKCEEFIYGGCRGNENNFSTKEDCEAKCGAVKGGYPQGPQGPPNSDSNPDNTDTSICHLPFEKGRCLAYFQRWGFDPNSGKCIQFVYGGCGANENNFETKEDCEQRCIATIPYPRPAGGNDTLDPVCRLPQDVGSCKAMTQRWSFDFSRGSCVKFYYGGCRGNANNFETREACEAKCSNSGAQPISKVDICKLPKKEGPCRGRNPRFYYDSASEQCLEFNYGGCRGNENNFFTKTECETRCADTV